MCLFLYFYINVWIYYWSCVKQLGKCKINIVCTIVRSGTHTIGEQSVPKLAEITGIVFLDLLYTLKQNIHEDSNVTCNN